MRKSLHKVRLQKWLLISMITCITLACVIPTTSAPTWVPPTNQATLPQLKETNSSSSNPIPESTPTSPWVDITEESVLDVTSTPTELNPDLLEYTVQENDTLALIAQRFDVAIEQILRVNNIPNPDLLNMGQKIYIPPSASKDPGSDFIIIPDAQLVNGPPSINFEVGSFVKQKGGYLMQYQEKVDDKLTNGPDIVTRVATEYSVNPRLLLAILEYQTAWVTKKTRPSKDLTEYSFLHVSGYEGLYQQLSWVANQLNYGYYSWQVKGISLWIFTDGNAVHIASTINAGTAGVQNLMSLLRNKSGWEKAVSSQGIYQTYMDLFGSPFDQVIDPVVPPDLTQPPMQLPFEKGETWSFTGGPHGGWGSGSAWAALDFAPPGESKGCVIADAWAVAVSDGLVVRSENGVVVQDLDKDGFEQTGWTVMYLHVDSADRVKVGTYLKSGDHVGHPSCEGGVSSATHLHLARRYNGEWIPADGSIPFNLDGWISSGTGKEYDGFLKRDDQTIEAWDSFRPENQIQR